MTRQNSFDFLRLLGAFLVFCSHHFALRGLPEPMAGALTTLGGLGVYIFFAISGFLITISWRRDPRFFYFTAKRLLRIMPGLVVTVTLGALVLGPMVSMLPISEYLGHPGLRFYFSNLVFHPVYALPGVFTDLPHPNAVNGSLWTLPLEFSLYFIILCFLVVPMSERRRVLVLAGTALGAGLLGLYLVFTPHDPVVFYGNDLRFLLLFAPFFLVGSLIACLGPERVLDIRVAGLLLVAFVFLPPSVMKIAAFFVLPYCVLSLGVLSVPGLRGAGRWGDFSYGLYIYAFPMQQLTIHLLGAETNQVVLFVLSLAATLLCAVLSWHYVEKPMLALKPRRGEHSRMPLEKPAAASQ